MPKEQLSIQQIKAAANEYAVKTRDKNVDGRMMTLAISSDGKQRVFGMSGGIKPDDGEVDPAAPYAQYLETYRAKAPWLALPSPGPANRPYYVCSEAHVWLELMGRNRNPKQFTVVSFNRLGIIASPCANCSLWVENAFGALYKETTSYEGHDRQRP
ncbi:hypothetical protein [Burkholderia gladioli]|jgi:hypothetical protein|uniref:hypothetical protein n=1 Tax=Burkholderia gladioli TaxID=28095 RepID=UPI000CDA716C|nr:hypothetical protein [Burkholderia gladioli]NRF82618.1 hypothetical protein [Burkholderia gladioli]POS07630.1 hypothetical protein C3Y08_13195 [Burkholderia gladioli]